MKNFKIDENIWALAENYKTEGDVGFGREMYPVMLVSDYANGEWSELRAIPYGPISLDPAAKVLHYAQEIFEGLKAYKNEKGEVFLFRPDMNAKRFNISADRMAMPSFPEEMFVESVKFLASVAHKTISDKKGSSLYFRPFMIATEPTMGVRPSNTYTYMLLASPADNYFSSPNVRVMIERDNCRATPGGTGYAKAGGNYAASLRAYQKTKEQECDQTLWLDALEKKYIEELSGMNFFAVVGEELQTPALSDSILAGVTRDSLLKLASSLGLRPVEKRMNIDSLLAQIESGECSEVFACGTAAVITPIDALVDNGREYRLKTVGEARQSLKLKNLLLDIQRGQAGEFKDWIVAIDPVQK